MALPAWLARFNHHATNRVTGTFAGWLPGFGIVRHVGRRSGRRYGTPVNVFRHEGIHVVALTYGSNSEWVKNVMAAGTCEIETGGAILRLTGPRIVTDDTRRVVPAPIRPLLRAIHVNQFLELT